MSFHNLCLFLCARLDLGQSLALLKAPLLLQPQDLEAVKVGESLPPVILQTLLVPVAGLPLAVHFCLLPGGLDGTVPRATGQIGNDNRSQKDISKGDCLPGDTTRVGICRGTIDENL